MGLYRQGTVVFSTGGYPCCVLQGRRLLGPQFGLFVLFHPISCSVTLLRYPVPVALRLFSVLNLVRTTALSFTPLFSAFHPILYHVSLFPRVVFIASSPVQLCGFPASSGVRQPRCASIHLHGKGRPVLNWPRACPVVF